MVPIDRKDDTVIIAGCDNLISLDDMRKPSISDYSGIEGND